jgi:serine/threonine protein kinase
MQGNTEQHQLTLIAQLCGAITPEVWPGVESLELYNKLEIPRNQKRRVKERLRPYVKDQYAVDLLDKLLCLCPEKRLDTNTALDHDFFWTDPMPVNLDKMLSQHTSSMFEFLAPRRTSGAAHRVGQQQQQQQQQGGPTASTSQTVPSSSVVGGQGIAAVGGAVVAAAAAGRHGQHHPGGGSSHHASRSRQKQQQQQPSDGGYVDRVF